MGTTKLTMVYRGNIEEFAHFWSFFITCVTSCVGGRNIKDKSLKPDDGGGGNLPLGISNIWDIIQLSRQGGEKGGLFDGKSHEPT